MISPNFIALILVGILFCKLRVPMYLHFGIFGHITTMHPRLGNTWKNCALVLWKRQTKTPRQAPILTRMNPFVTETCKLFSLNDLTVPKLQKRHWGHLTSRQPKHFTCVITLQSPPAHGKRTKVDLRAYP